LLSLSHLSHCLFTFPYSGTLIVIHLHQHAMPKSRCGLLVQGYGLQCHSLKSAGPASAHQVIHDFFVIG
jgi:hypothetical protein